MRKHYVGISPDDIPIEPEGYTTQDAAERSLEKWIERFRLQGYYGMSNGYRIPFENIHKHCRIQELVASHPFNPMRSEFQVTKRLS